MFFVVVINWSTTRSNEQSTFFSLHVRLADQLLNLPRDITFEICTSSSPSPPAPTSSTSSSATHGVAEDTFSAEDTDNTFIKAEREVSGVHFLTDREEDRADDLLLPKTETGENEPEVRKQVGCSRHDF